MLLRSVWIRRELLCKLVATLRDDFRAVGCAGSSGASERQPLFMPCYSLRQTETRVTAEVFLKKRFLWMINLWKTQPGDGVSVHPLTPHSHPHPTHTLPPTPSLLRFLCSLPPSSLFSPFLPFSPLFSPFSPPFPSPPHSPTHHHHPTTVSGSVEPGSSSGHTDS